LSCLCARWWRPAARLIPWPPCERVHATSRQPSTLPGQCSNGVSTSDISLLSEAWRPSPCRCGVSATSTQLALTHWACSPPTARKTRASLGAWSILAEAHLDHRPGCCVLERAQPGPAGHKPGRFRWCLKAGSRSSSRRARPRPTAKVGPVRTAHRRAMPPSLPLPEA